LASYLTGVIPGRAKHEPGIHFTAELRPDGFRVLAFASPQVRNCAPGNDGSDSLLKEGALLYLAGRMNGGSYE
jgi:hypothetical protein